MPRRTAAIKMTQDRVSKDVERTPETHPHQCERCGERFTQPQHLDMHMKKHEKEDRESGAAPKNPLEGKRFFVSSKRGLKILLKTHGADSTLNEYAKFTPQRVMHNGDLEWVGILATDSEEVIGRLKELSSVKEVSRAQYTKLQLPIEETNVSPFEAITSEDE